MDKIILKNTLHHTTTILPNEFIDHYMIKADGEYVKIYLLILRLMNQNLPVQIDQLADTLELTQKDIIRALKYWEKEGLLELEDSSAAKAQNEQPAGQGMLAGQQAGQTAGEADQGRQAGQTDSMAGGGVSYPTLPQVPEKKSRNMSEMEKSIKGTDLEQTLYMAETYLGRPLSASELNSFCYINDSLHFSSDLLEYLIEYCISRGKKSVRYMESVAINWFQQGIDTIKKAKEESSQYTQNVFPVMKAFGINRNPGPAELDYIKKWNALGFETDIIIEACNRTLLATHQASFPYANRILDDWKKAGVRNVADIRSLDQKFHAAAQTDGAPEKSSGRQNRQAQQNYNRNSSNAFHNFEQRTYDYDDLESRLLEKNRR